MRFDFDSETRRRLGYRLIDQIDAFFSSLPDRAVQLPLEQRSYGPIHDPLPEAGEDATKVLDELCREMVAFSQAMVDPARARPQSLRRTD